MSGLSTTVPSGTWDWNDMSPRYIDPTVATIALAILSATILCGWL